MSTTRMRLGALVTAGVLGLGLSACGGDDTAGEAATSATDAAAASGSDDAADDTAAESEPADSGSEGGAAAEGEEIPIEDFIAMLKEPGEETLSTYTMTMSMDMEGQTMDAEGAVDISGESPAMEMTMTVPELGEMEMITLDGQAYIAMPGVTPEGMYMSAGEELLGEEADLSEIDISSQWDAWEQGAEKVVFVGDEDVDGTELAHYQLTVDPVAAAEAMGTDAAAITAELGDEPVLYDVWLDDENLMRQISFDLDGSVAEMTMDNWGEPQDIQAPAEDKIMDMSELGGNTGR